MSHVTTSLVRHLNINMFFFIIRMRFLVEMPSGTGTALTSNELNPVNGIDMTTASESAGRQI
jgi:hypothetical protein